MLEELQKLTAELAESNEKLKNIADGEGNMKDDITRARFLVQNLKSDTSGLDKALASLEEDIKALEKALHDVIESERDIVKTIEAKQKETA